MNSLLYFLKFKGLDRTGLTIQIGLFTISTLSLLYLICSFNSGQFLALDASTLKLILRSTPDLIFTAIFGAILLYFLAVLLPWIREFFGYILTRIETSDSFSLVPEDCLNNIDFQGIVEKKDKGFLITSSGSGMLFKHYCWKDFEANIEFIFDGEYNSSLKTSYERTRLQNEYSTANNYLGFIFRARDFDNYFMLSIGVKIFITQAKRVIGKNLEGREYLLITPHVKVGGAWDVFTENKWYVKDVKNFSINGNNKFKIQVRGNLLKLWIEKSYKKGNRKNQEKKEENNKPFFTWNLPTHYLINWGEIKVTDSYPSGDSLKIPFRNNFGRIGFRAYGDEKFFIKSLIIKK